MNVIRPLLLLTIILTISNSMPGQTNLHFIDKIQNYQQNVKLDNSSEFTLIDSTTFDTKVYLKMFDKLEITTSLKPQVFYVADMFGGSPYLVVVPDTFEVSRYIESELKKVKKDSFYDPDNARGEIMSNLMQRTQKLSDNIVPTNSEEGFLQYLFFNQMAECFALFGHSNYREKFIVSSTKKFIERMKPFRKSTSFSVDKKEYTKLKTQEMTPKISFKEDKCIIEWYEIETHNGVYKRTYEIENFAPYKIEQIENEKVLNIQPNFLY
ncbi:hypothetical protein [uncultured Draconibacterium sp.]|uniref:hypothetical protein n=1 Tax=uncultured Draconibacterium sp. TaxID=1573823 RepID=UPI003216D110